MPKDRPARKRSLGGMVCAKCGGVAIAGLCGGLCLTGGMPTHAEPPPAGPETVAMVCLPATPHFGPVTAPPALAAVLAGEPEHRDRPELDVTLYGDAFVPAVVTGQPAPRGRGGGWT